MKTKKIILIMLIILLNGIVFMFSGQTGEKSVIQLSLKS